MQPWLSMAIERRASTAAIFDGSVPAPGGLQVQVADAKPVNATFARMVRGLEFDICELGISTLFLARAHGCPIVGLPVFTAGYYPHPLIECGLRSGVKSPADLAGARIGVRSFTMPSVVWACGVLSRQFGVDTSSISWVTAGEETVPGLALPPNVSPSVGSDLRGMLDRGELHAVIGLAVGAEHAYPLWADTAAVERDWLALAGGPPLNHAIVVREELVDRDDGLAAALVTWFRAAARAASGSAGGGVGGLGPGGLGPGGLGPGGLGAGGLGAGAGAGGLGISDLASLRMLLELTREQLPGETGLSGRVEDAFVDMAIGSGA